jgi:hypothetical protein
MPFPGVDPWRWQYFKDQHCPPDVVIPIDDASAWELHTGHRAIYNKLLVCESQGIACGPHGTTARRFPVFSKPIYNMRGMGAGSRAIAYATEYENSLQPGHMWMELLQGEHVSSDLALLHGKVMWCRHTTGEPGAGGTFDYWTIHAEAKPALESYLQEWLARNLDGFTGIVNVETIGGRIIECHLRMAEQWLDLNGEGWLAAVVALYEKGLWQFRDARRTGYSVVLFGAHGIDWRIDRGRVRELLVDPDISSIQITFDESVSREAHAMPPGGFRLAIVNCWNLEAGKRARALLQQAFKRAG